MYINPHAYQFAYIKNEFHLPFTILQLSVEVFLQLQICQLPFSVGLDDLRSLKISLSLPHLLLTTTSFWNTQHQFMWYSTVKTCHFFQSLLSHPQPPCTFPNGCWTLPLWKRPCILLGISVRLHLFLSDGMTPSAILYLIGTGRQMWIFLYWRGLELPLEGLRSALIIWPSCMGSNSDRVVPEKKEDHRLITYIQGRALGS